MTFCLKCIHTSSCIIQQLNNITEVKAVCLFFYLSSYMCNITSSFLTALLKGLVIGRITIIIQSLLTSNIFYITISYIKADPWRGRAREESQTFWPGWYFGAGVRCWSASCWFYAVCLTQSQSGLPSKPSGLASSDAGWRDLLPHPPEQQKGGWKSMVAMKGDMPVNELTRELRAYSTQGRRGDEKAGCWEVMHGVLSSLTTPSC